VPQQPSNCRFLRCGASFEPLLDLEVGSSFVSGRGDPCFHLGLPRPSGVQLALQQSQPIDLSLRGVEEGRRPL